MILTYKYEMWDVHGAATSNCKYIFTPILNDKTVFTRNILTD